MQAGRNAPQGFSLLCVRLREKGLEPRLAAHAVATNDDWGGTTTLKNAFASVGAFAFSSDASRDAAIAVELPSGAFTATVSGKNNSTGVALVAGNELP